MKNLETKLIKSVRIITNKDDYIADILIEKEKILSISTIGGAKCLGLDKKIGSIEIKKRADLIAFEIKDRNPFDSIIFREGKNISFKMIDGKIKKFQ